MPLTTYRNTATERFLRYVQLDTQSDPHSATYPSTEKQKALGRLLADELRALGLADAHLDEWGYVYATLPATTDQSVPVICFCSHVDTSPDSSGANVKPIIHKNYDGSDLVLPDDPTQIIRRSEHPDLQDQLGNDIITASGNTLLGADNKAGLAEIMDAVQYLLTHPEIKHGTVKILFTPDEEIGRGTAKVDLDKLDADYGYTVDGETRGSLEDETFSADGVSITFHGVSAHPGFAKGKLESALKMAAELVAKLPKDVLSPESTTGREGFVHPVGLKGAVETATVEFIVRDFSEDGLLRHESLLRTLTDEVMSAYPRSRAEIEVVEQYRNMKEILDLHPAVSDFAEEAIRRAGLEPRKMSIRGGTDGSRLSFMGLPCPNLFAGEHAFHSKHEWVSVQDMEKAVEVIVHLCQIWAEKSNEK
ncbi:MAG: peptidase T [Cytophagaceae bacterium]|nr:peptidase T [Cytophagaceae bacterium]